LPLLDRRSYVYGVGYETVRRGEVIDSLERFRSEGDLPRLWAAVRRAKIDAALSDTPTVEGFSNVLACATKYKLICENVARRAADTTFAPKDVRVLEKALKELDQLKLGPKLWKDNRYPLLLRMDSLRPHLETLRRLVQEHRAGCARYCSAWLALMNSGELRSSFDLEVSTARWLLAFPDAAEELGRMVSDGVKLEYWRSIESIEGSISETEIASQPAELTPKEAHLVKVLVLAGNLERQAKAPPDPPKEEEEEKTAKGDGLRKKGRRKGEGLRKDAQAALEVALGADDDMEDGLRKDAQAALEAALGADDDMEGGLRQDAQAALEAALGADDDMEDALRRDGQAALEAALGADDDMEETLRRDGQAALEAALGVDLGADDAMEAQAASAQAEAPQNEASVSYQDDFEDEAAVEEQVPAKEEVAAEDQVPANEDAAAAEQAPANEASVSYQDDFEDEAAVEEQAPANEEAAAAEQAPAKEEAAIEEQAPAQEETATEEQVPSKKAVVAEEAEAAAEGEAPAEQAVVADPEASVEESAPQ